MKVSIVLPCYNEEKILEQSILRTLEYCRSNVTIDWEVVIADNMSTDKTADIGKALAADHDNIFYLYVDQVGKGVAIKRAWQDRDADYYLFMDADLATDLSAIQSALAFAAENDLVVGSRYHQDSQVKRTIFRKFFSFGYRAVLKLVLNVNISDAPCGFKLINKKVRDEVLPLVQNNKWFFDSELLILSESKGFKVKEIPVSWEDPREDGDKSRVKAFSLSLAYFQEVLKLKKRLK